VVGNRGRMSLNGSASPARPNSNASALPTHPSTTPTPLHRAPPHYTQCRISHKARFSRMDVYVCCMTLKSHVRLATSLHGRSITSKQTLFVRCQQSHFGPQRLYRRHLHNVAPFPIQPQHKSSRRYKWDVDSEQRGSRD
jgi:hypothetical protein